MKNIQKQFMKEFNEPITKIGLFNSERNKDVTCQVEIWNDKYIQWLETKLSERQTSIKVDKQCDSKALRIANVNGCFCELPKSAKEKLDNILGSAITREFPKIEPTREWAGAVLDFFEIIGLIE